MNPFAFNLLLQFLMKKLNPTISNIILCLLIFLCLSYSINLKENFFLPIHRCQPLEGNQKLPSQVKTNLSHIIFGIAATSNSWNHRKEYVKFWWKPKEMKGIIWLDKPVKDNPNDSNLLPSKFISSDTSNFLDASFGRTSIRISRIVSDTLKLGIKDVRWFVIGDDDTVFITDNLVRVLSKYDHNQYYYIGSISEGHVRNIVFSYNMAYGGGGIAISYPLAKTLSKRLDWCIKRYPELYGSDERIHACMAEIGVPLTKEPGFHQFDVLGDVFGLLTAHPIAPLVSLHHLDYLSPIFPNSNSTQALQKLKASVQLDSAALMQQSICYDQMRNWTISVSWGYAVQIFRGIIFPLEIEKPARTFVDFHKSEPHYSFTFNTRPFAMNKCQTPFVYYLSNVIVYDPDRNYTASEYVENKIRRPKCDWNMANPSQITRVEVYKKFDSFLWDKAPRRNSCKVLKTKKEGTLVLGVGLLEEDKIIETDDWK